MTDRRLNVTYKGIEYEVFQKMDKTTRMYCELCDKQIKKGDFYTNQADGPGPCCEECFSE
jgi:hypothetical protein